jgi:hypothetical protein
MLPTASYVHLLHQGAMTGFLPRFDPEGKPTGQFDNLAPKDRLDIARYLIDKVVPDAPKELALTVAPPETLDATNISNLSSDELRRIAIDARDAAAGIVDTTPDLAVPAGADSERVGAA